MIFHGERSSTVGDPDYSHFSLEISPEEWQQLQNDLSGGHARLEKEGWTIELTSISEGLALRLNIFTQTGGLIMRENDESIVLRREVKR